MRAAVATAGRRLEQPWNPVPGTPRDDGLPRSAARADRVAAGGRGLMARRRPLDRGPRARAQAACGDAAVGGSLEAGAEDARGRPPARSCRAARHAAAVATGCDDRVVRPGPAERLLPGSSKPRSRCERSGGSSPVQRCEAVCSPRRKGAPSTYRPRARAGRKVAVGRQRRTWGGSSHGRARERASAVETRNSRRNQPRPRAKGTSGDNGTLAASTGHGRERARR